MKYASCSKCGDDAQNAEPYCRRCGEWLPNPNVNLSSDLLRQRTTDQLRNMRFLQAVSAGLSLVAAAVTTIVLVTNLDAPLLFLAILCCLVVAIYQLITICLSYTLPELMNRSHFGKSDTINLPAKRSGKLRPTVRTLLVYRSTSKTTPRK